MVDKLEAGERWQHVKRGTFYDVIGRAELQNGNVRGLREGAYLVVYRGDDGKLWARDVGEFTDGRFVPVAPATVTETAKVADTDWQAEMPTIWEDPAGKGYPCFERPMTPAEARDTIERYGRQLAERANAAEDAREQFAENAKISERATLMQEALEAVNDAMLYGGDGATGIVAGALLAVAQRREPDFAAGLPVIARLPG